MDNIEIAIDEAKKFIQSMPVYKEGINLSGDEGEHFQSTMDWISKRKKFEDEFGVGTLEDQFGWFICLCALAKDPTFGGSHTLANLMFTGWAGKTKNLFGYAYTIGEEDGRETGLRIGRGKLESERMRRALNGKRLIGATTRENIAEQERAKVQSEIRERLSAAGVQGGKKRSDIFEPIRQWTRDKAITMHGGKKEIARNLMRSVPKEFFDISADPERLIYETLRSTGK